MSPIDIRSDNWTYVLDEPTRILVVDDDPILCEFATVYLATPMTTIDTAADGEAALARLTAGDYDVVLVDIEMPRMDGFSLVERIRADARLGDMPVIMLTGHEDIASIDRAYQVGATSFVAKPVNWRQLSYQIRYVIRTTRKKHTRLHDDPAASMRISLEQIIARLDDLTGKIPSGCWPLSYDDIRSAREIAQRALATLSVKPDRSEAAQGEKNVAA